MGKEVVNGGLEPITMGTVLVWGIFAGSAVTHHTAPPDEARITDAECGALCRRAAEVDLPAFDMAIPSIWRPWWNTLTSAERAAVWRGCRALWVRFGAGW